uniref:Protein brambleberry n=1 Tax=Strigamia maritima TaxID=126957 RepID=T1J0G9_STRMM
MKMSNHLFIFLYLILEYTAHGIEFESVAVEEGKKQYTSLSRESQMPEFGSCWKNALNELNIGCKHLTDDTQSRLALAFTNCFLEKSGMETRICRPNQQISECVRILDFKGYTTYANFFTHTHSMCIFLQSQVWHEETGKVIVKLNENSVNVTRQLEQAQNLQIQLIKNQRKSMEAQDKLWNKGHELSRVLEMSKENVRQVAYDFKSSTEEQRQIIAQIFDRISSLQSILLGEVTGFYSILYNVIAAVAVYLITSTARTRGARFWLFVILVVNFSLERIIVWMADYSGVYVEHKEVETLIHFRQWNCRKLSAGIATLVLFFEIYRYRDYNLLNNQLLMEIKQQNLDISSFIRENRNLGKLNGSISFANSRLGDSFTNDNTVHDETNLMASTELSIPKFASTPIKRRNEVVDHSSSHRYNLRNRKLIHPNSVIENETPDQFCDLVHDLAQRSNRAGKAFRSFLPKSTNALSDLSQEF